VAEAEAVLVHLRAEAEAQKARLIRHLQDPQEEMAVAGGHPEALVDYRVAEAEAEVHQDQVQVARVARAMATAQVVAEVAVRRVALLEQAEPEAPLS
jgi:hypothetical protein